jgi:hypothetical protein
MTPPDRPPSREVIDLQFAVINDKLDKILEQARLTNGRLRAAEKTIAVLSWAYGLGAVVIAWIVVETVKR